MELPQRIQECVLAIREKGVKQQPKIGIILGTGLGGLIEAIQVEHQLDYGQLPHFVQSTVESHHGKFIFGKMEGHDVVCMQGRFHYYEGYSMDEITFPIRVMKALGVTHLIVSNAAGAINTQFKAGDLMLITDHINLLGANPLIGKNYPSLGDRWPDMIEPYSQALLKLAQEVALEEKIQVQKGVYTCMSGPCLETKAEYRMLKLIGTDAIGMSTVPEVIVAVHAKMSVLGISVLTDECFPDALEPCDIQKILGNAAKAEPKLIKIIRGVIKKVV